VRYVRYRFELTEEDDDLLIVHLHPPLVDAHKYDPDDPINDKRPELERALMATQMFISVTCFPARIEIQRSLLLRWIEIEHYLVSVLSLELAFKDWELYEYENPFMYHYDEERNCYKIPVILVYEEDE